MRRTRRIALSTAVTTGVLGVAGVAAAAIPGIGSAGSTPTTGALSDQNAAEKLALQRALDAIDGQTRALGSDLTAAQAQLAAERRAADAAATAAAVRQRVTAHPTQATRPVKHKIIYIQSPAGTTPKPKPHTITGASGSTGGDDGGSDDGGGGGGDD